LIGFAVLVGAHVILTGAETGETGERIIGETLLEFGEDHGGIEELGIGEFVEAENFGLGWLVLLFAQRVGLLFEGEAGLLEISAEAGHHGGDEFVVRILVGELHVFLDGVFGFAHFFVNEGGLELRLGSEFGFGVVEGIFEKRARASWYIGSLASSFFGEVGVFLGEVA
jgi:hypothetical protein